MKYKVETKLNDGKLEAPPVEVEVTNLYELADAVVEEMANDYDEPFGIGMTTTIERLA